METLLNYLEKGALQAIESAFGKSTPPDITQSTKEHFGHYQCNVALKLAKELKMAPRDVATQIVEHFQCDGIESLEIAGPGFINIRLTSQFLSDQLNAMLTSAKLGLPERKASKVIVEFSSPNIAKELHVGHLRSTIIGESLARLFEYLGDDVLRLNHVGDWGTQFGMLIAYLKSEQPHVLKSVEGVELSDLMGWYKDAKMRFDADPAFKKESQEQVVKLQGGDEDSITAWQMICTISRKGFERIYQLLDVSIEERGESFYNPMLEGIVNDLSERGISEFSDGAECIFMDGFLTKEKTPLPLIVRKADGGFNYASTDLAALKHRVDKEVASRIIYVVDMGQRLHFQMVFQAAKQAGYYKSDQVRLDHVDFGVVLGEDGKKFKTRSGETVKLIDLLDEAVLRAKEIMKSRLTDASEAEIEHSAVVLGMNAVKYADLSCHRVKDYVFSYDRMLQFEGNTAAFLLYSYVRIQSIKRKSQKDIASLRGKIQLEHKSEIALALQLRQFHEMLQIAAEELIPNRICDYLYGLAQAFNHFFRDCHVQGSEQEESRLKLCQLTSEVLEQGLKILGLHTLDKM